MISDHDNDADPAGEPDDFDLATCQHSVDTAPCPYCGKMVYEQADVCPHCHSFIIWRQSASHRYGRWFVLGAAAGLLAVLCWVLLLK